MGQLALGFRSLLIKAIIFFVMAGLLAWSLGGWLFPKPTIVDLPKVVGDYHWRVSSGTQIEGLQWSLIRGDQEFTIGLLQSVVGPVIVDGVTWIATFDAGEWSCSRVTGDTIEVIADPSEDVFDALFPPSEK